jgi:hypothetical protein
MTGDRPAEPGTAFAPEMPGYARRLVTRCGCRHHSHRPGLVGAGIVMFLFLITSAPLGIQTLMSLITAIGCISFCLACPALNAAAALMRHRYRDRFISQPGLDRPSQDLLLRAQAAIRAVLASQVHQAGQLDDAANVTVLPLQEWEIARQLRDLSQLRGEHARIAAAAPRQAPAVAEVAGPQREILGQVQAAVTARVEALEGYADRVRAADGAYRNWQQALALAGLNDGLLDLLARTAADAQAAEEIAGLSAQARAAEETFRGTLNDARTAAGPVVLPAPAASRPTPSAA